MTVEKYILCRPQGGLNDMLGVIEQCCRYGEATGRTVLVDTDYAHSVYFKDAFSNYFRSRQSRLILDPSQILPTLDEDSVYPHFLKGRLASYQTEPVKVGSIFVHLDTAFKKPVAFKMNQVYSERTLVYQQFGGGSLSLYALLRLTLAPAITDDLASRIDAIGRPYLGVHVRNTDYKTRYEQYLQSLTQKNYKAVFVATDNVLTLQDFQNKLGAAVVHSFSNIAGATGNPIHEFRNADINHEERNQDAILDLLTLALARQLKIFNLDTTGKVRLSGFSRLASDLWSKKPILSLLLQGSHLKIGLDQ